MDYRIVDLNEWSRGNLFQFYMDHMRIVMSLAVDIDVTSLKAYSQKQGLDFYPLMLWVVSKVINSHDEFKLGWDQAGNLSNGPMSRRLIRIFTPRMSRLPKWSPNIQMTCGSSAKELQRTEHGISRTVQCWIINRRISLMFLVFHG